MEFHFWSLRYHYTNFLAKIQQAAVTGQTYRHTASVPNTFTQCVLYPVRVIMLGFGSDLNRGGITIQNWLEDTEGIVYRADCND